MNQRAVCGSVQEFLQIEIDDPAVPVRDILLRPSHRLMRGSTLRGLLAAFPSGVG